MDWFLFAVFLVTCGAAGATGAVFQPGRWYVGLDKPRWTPPDWAFPVAWTTIYLLISFAGARVAGQDGSAYALAFWAAQGAFATLWTPVFFGLRRLKGALYVMAPLWISVAGATWHHFAVDPWAGAAFLPYLAWVTVAAALNYSVWRRNPNETPIVPSDL